MRFTLSPRALNSEDLNSGGVSDTFFGAPSASKVAQVQKKLMSGGGGGGGGRGGLRHLFRSAISVESRASPKKADDQCGPGPR